MDRRAVVFDFDGVLADTEGLHLRAFQDVFAARGWRLDRAEYLERYMGFDDRDLVRAFAADARRPLSTADEEVILADKARLYERRVAAGSVLFPNAPAAIARLGARYRLAIASGSLRAEIAAVLAANDLSQAIGAVIGADDVARSKPAPDAYTAAVAAIGVPASRAVAIEDSRWGLVSAREAGLRTIGITTSYPPGALDLADMIVHDLDEITTDVVDALLGKASAQART
jgi:HAD superfamily hydrolase (TIGR01509 family)